MATQRERGGAHDGMREEDRRCRFADLAICISGFAFCNSLFWLTATGSFNFWRIRLRLRSLWSVDDEDRAIGRRGDEPTHERSGARGERLLDVERGDRLAVGCGAALDDALAVCEHDTV